MTFNSPDDVFKFIRDNQAVKPWVIKARDNHKVLNALVTGKDFNDVLIERIEKIESEDRKAARKRYSKDIRDMFDRVMQPRISVFSASGGSVNIDIDSLIVKEKLLNTLSQFKGQKSIVRYLSENFFRLEDTDPNGLIFLEYVRDEKIEPTYKCINDIRYYESTGQLLSVVMFEPKVLHGGVIQWRVVDDKKDWCVLQTGQTFIVNEDKTFDHPFGSVPAVVLSDVQELGSEIRVSPIFPIEELAKEYARDKSIKTIYKFQHGFPRHWRYVKECRTCHGVGKTGESTCKHCNGAGHIQRNDVTDVQTIALPREDDQIVTPNVEGFISPDLETWKQYNEDMRTLEELIESTMWGTKRITESKNETATGRFIDVQPVINKLGKFTDNVEWVHNKLASWVQNWMNGMPVDSKYSYTYGRRFIIESPDVILEKYSQAKESGENAVILDRLLDEYLLSRYQNNPVLLDEQQKKRLVEPYIHQTLKDVHEIFGAEEANKKIVFIEFWELADKTKSVAELRSDFVTYVSNDLQSKRLSEIEMTRKLISQVSPFIAQEGLSRMSDEQVLALFGSKPDGKTNSKVISKSNNI